MVVVAGIRAAEDSEWDSEFGKLDHYGPAVHVARAQFPSAHHRKSVSGAEVLQREEKLWAVLDEATSGRLLFEDKRADRIQEFMLLLYCESVLGDSHQADEDRRVQGGTTRPS